MIVSCEQRVMLGASTELDEERRLINSAEFLGEIDGKLQKEIELKIEGLSLNVQRLVELHLGSIRLLWLNRHAKHSIDGKCSRARADIDAFGLTIERLSELKTLLNDIQPSDLPYVPMYEI